MSVRLAALIRHGAYHQRPGAPSALQPYPLTAKGEAEARDCGAEIARLVREGSLTLDPVLHSSCQLRAWQSASLAAEALREAGLRIDRIEQSPDLSERSVGSAGNLTTAEIEQILEQDPRFERPPPGWKSDSDYCLPLQGAESLMMAGHRVAGYLGAVLGGPSAGDLPCLTLFFGHGASFRHAAHVLGILDRDEIDALSMYHCRPVLIRREPGGEWSHHSGAWKRRRTGEMVTD
ncbi:histidine phosphatase family protein [Rhodobacteraceae bacterium NNCM2]|nr:histidine phosphatase family protein [Coraliihabitans acroporae]